MSLSKRLFDIVWSLLGLVVLLPALLVIWLGILTLDGRPAFFLQERVGFHGRVFRIYKFRTMVLGAHRLGQSLTIGRDARVTRIGHWLRKYKLDELPQLFNVLRGEMSLVGPRPEVPKFVALYSPEQRKVLELVPGITDPASIVFRDEAGLLVDCEDPERVYVERIMPEKIQLNLAYAAKSGVMADTGIIWWTLKAVCTNTTRDTQFNKPN